MFSSNKGKKAEQAEEDVSEPPPEYYMYALDTDEQQALEDTFAEAETTAYSAQNTALACTAHKPIPNFSDLKFDEKYHGKNVAVTVKGTQAERLKK